jgi:OOP family OmpA-OmpF porin
MLLVVYNTAPLSIRDRNNQGKQMKKTLLIALIAAATAAPAMAGDTYIGANIGRASQKLSIDGVGSIKDNTTGVSLYTGYQFDKSFGIEGGLAYLGKAEISAAGVTATAKPQTLYVAGTATLPLDNQFNLFAKVGVARTHTKLTATGAGSDSNNDTSALVSVGASYIIDKNLSAVLEYTDFGKLVKEDGGSLKGNLLSVGLRYTF